MVSEERTLLICCTAFRAKSDAFPNLTLKKIPKAVLNRCEWGRDDYSLKIADLPPAPVEDTPPPNDEKKVRSGKARKERQAELPLFATGGNE